MVKDSNMDALESRWGAPKTAWGIRSPWFIALGARTDNRTLALDMVCQHAGMAPLRGS